MDDSLATIYQDGRHYDRLFTGDRPELPFYRWAAEQGGGPVLELACGTGRLSLPLAEAGFDVTGLDASAAMLATARAKAATAGVKVTWLQGRMQAFTLARRFGLIFVANNTFCHLLTNVEAAACLAAVRRHLRPGGVLALDQFVPDPALLVERPDERLPFGSYEDPDGGGRVVVTYSYVYDGASQIRHLTTYHHFPGEEEPVSGRMAMRMYFPQELDTLLRCNGFTLVHKFGTFDRQPFNHETTQQIILARPGDAPTQFQSSAPGVGNA